jgi:hypothetical protein
VHGDPRTTGFLGQCPGLQPVNPGIPGRIHRPLQIGQKAGPHSSRVMKGLGPDKAFLLRALPGHFGGHRPVRLLQGREFAAQTLLLFSRLGRPLCRAPRQGTERKCHGGRSRHQSGTAATAVLLRQQVAWHQDEGLLVRRRRQGEAQQDGEDRPLLVGRRRTGLTRLSHGGPDVERHDRESEAERQRPRREGGSRRLSCDHTPDRRVGGAQARGDPGDLKVNTVPPTWSSRRRNLRHDPERPTRSVHDHHLNRRSTTIHEQAGTALARIEVTKTPI